MRDLITTFSDLYITSDEETERAEDNDPDEELHFPPPPPPLIDETNVQSSPVNPMLTARVTSLEAQLTDLENGVSGKVSSVELEKQCRKLEDKMSYLVQRECERVKQQLEMLVKDLGQSMVDCLKRRDWQLEHKFQSMRPPSSTPFVTSQNPLANTQNHYAKPSNLTYTEQSTQSNQSSLQYNPPVKLEFPSFSNSQEDDPVVFVEQCEEYFAVRPLNEEEILASLTAVLKGTAKDWWRAERRKVSNWKEFKDRFLSSFLSEDHEEVAARKLLEGKQGVKENICDFSFHYRALCLRWRKEMTEKEIVQAILRNCNPRLASLLRGTIKDVEELVRIGTQIELTVRSRGRKQSPPSVNENPPMQVIM